MSLTLERDDWARLVDQLDDPAVGVVAEALADDCDVDPLDAYDVVEAAVDEGALLEEDAGGALPAVRLPETDETAETGDTDTRGGGYPDDDPQGETGETTVADAEAHLSGEVFHPDAVAEREVWVTWILDGAGRKRPVAPWQNGHAYPAEWSSDLDEEDRPETDYETAARWAAFDLADAGLALPDDARCDQLELGIILPHDRADDPEERLTLIDWDDVRDPDTGAVHPVAADFINRYGGFVEVSTSGKGLHQFVEGGLRKRGKFIAPIDGEPFVGEDLPQVEIYDGGRHVAMTGRHVAGSGRDVIRGQGMIDELVTQYASAEVDAGHRVYDPETGSGATATDTDTDDETEGNSGGHVPDPESVEYAGPTVEEYRSRKPDDRSLDYHVAVEAFYRGAGNSGGYAAIQNWRLEGFAAALGERDDLTPDAVKSDLAGRYLDETDVEKGCEHRTPERVDYAHKRAANDRLQAPSRETLAAYGVLPPEAVDDEDPVAALPLERLDQLDTQEARRYASKHGVSWPTTREARERLRSSIMETMRHGDQRLHDAPTALGKSYTVATEPWLDRADTTGGSPVVQLSETREARDQAAEASRDAGVRFARLLGRSEACPVAAGEHDPATDGEDDPDVVITRDGVPASDWFDRVCEGRGVPFSVAHAALEERNDQDVDLPCCGEGECLSIAQWDGLPRDDEGNPTVDVIHATHGFAHVPSLRNGTNLIFDERPSFGADLTHDRVRRAVTAYLSEAGAPTATYEQFVSRTLRGDNNPNEHAEHAFISRALDYEPDRKWYLEADGAHTLAPALTRAIYWALLPDDEEGDAADANGRYAATVPHEPPRLDKDASDDSTWNRTYVSVVLDEDLTVRVVRNSPSMAGARSVVGLDAHPEVTLWQRNVHPDILIEPVLGPSERALWRRYERGLLTVGVGDATRPLTSGEYFDEDGSRAFFVALRDHFGPRFSTAITAASVESRTADLLEDIGVDDPATMHYGEEKSRGDFGDEDVGALNGCIDPGDDYVLDLLAEAGLDARPETTTDDDGDEHRAHGREFVGPDADLAASLLASVREQHVAQAAGRYARNADDPDDRAIVFVRTDAAPTGFVDLTVPGVEWLPTDDQQAIVDALRTQRDATAGELAEAADVSKEHVRKTLRRLRDRGVVDVRKGAGDHGAHLYRALGGLGSGECVDLDPQTANDRVWDSYTWSLAIDEPVAVVRPTVGTSSADLHRGDTADAGETGGDPPP